MNLEDIMGERFGRYSKYIIQDRALPDIRDGLKPVQRRIMYAMYIDNNTYNNAYRKSAKTVGNVIGNYHPHGDTSVYDAMVRLSQDWKLRNPLVEMHGNNGSIDGDSAAAMRYTEARLAKISSLLLDDIKMNTVDMIYNFDDTLLEPTVLPAKFPNLLVNGSSGISAGYATNIPPHNLDEIIKALIFLIKNPNCRVETLFKYVNGPDFPLGGIVSGRKEIEDSLRTGKGRVVVKSKYEIVNVKGKKSIIVTEIPYEVNKANLIYKIEEIRELSKVSGISEVRDESDKNGIRIAIDLKKDADEVLVVNYLFKNTDLQVYYNYNMVSIVNRKPKLVGLKEMLEAYYNHQVEVLTRKCNFELNKILKRLHIIEGLVIALDKIDLLIKIIRASQNKKEAIENISKEFGLTNEQSEAIVNLQLYRLTNTDINDLLLEKEKINDRVNYLKNILSNPSVLDDELVKMFKTIAKEYGTPRRTAVEEVYEVIKIDEKDLISNDEVILTVTKDGYVKKTSIKSFTSSEMESYVKKEDDFLIHASKCFELDYVIAFTNLGNYLVVPVYDINYKKWKELGEHLSGYVSMKSDEEIISAYVIENFDLDYKVTLFSSGGNGKQVELSTLNISRFNKTYKIFNLAKGETLITATFDTSSECVLVTKAGYSLRFDSDQLSVQGAKTKGVKVIDLKDDALVYAYPVIDKYLLTHTNTNKVRRIAVEDITKLSRGRKGTMILNSAKSNPSYYENILQVNIGEIILRFGSNISTYKSSAVSIISGKALGSEINKTKVVDIAMLIENVSTTFRNNEQKMPKSNKNIEKSPLNSDVNDVIIKEVNKEEVEFEEITIDDFLD